MIVFMCTLSLSLSLSLSLFLSFFLSLSLTIVHICTQVVTEDEVTKSFTTEGRFTIKYLSPKCPITQSCMLPSPLPLFPSSEVEEWNFLTRTQMHTSLGYTCTLEFIVLIFCILSFFCIVLWWRVLLWFLLRLRLELLLYVSIVFRFAIFFIIRLVNPVFALLSLAQLSWYVP